ncbi:response regulator transcription factor [Spirosoma litoris]
MKRSSILTYQKYLDLLAEQPQSSAWDYAQYVKEAQSMHSFMELSSTVIFLLDFRTKDYPLVSHSAYQVMGHPNEAFYEGGLAFVLHHNTDFATLNNTIFPNEVAFLANLSSQDLAQYRFSKTYRFRGIKGELRTLLQRHTIIGNTDNSAPTAIFGFAWDITDQAKKGKLIHQIEQYNLQERVWNIVLSNEYFPDVDPDKLLSKREIEILKWAVEGYSSKQIADKLCLSFNTVNTHRRNMLRKTNSQNSMDLLRYAIRYGLL